MYLSGLLAVALVAATPDASTRQARIADAVRIWAEIRYRHPAVALGQVDWDRALAEAVPGLLDAVDDSAADRVLGTMVAALGDPGTQLVGSIPNIQRFSSLEARWVDPKTLVLVLRPLESYKALESEMKRLGPELDRAGRLVLDLRGQPPAWASETTDVVDTLEALAPWLLSQEVHVPPAAAVQRQGFAGAMSTSGGYETRWVLSAAPPFIPRPGPRRALTFIVDSSVAVEPMLVGLQRAGRAAIVSVGATRPGVNRVNLVQISPRIRLSLAARTVLAGSWTPDFELRPEEGSRAIEVATGLLDHPPAARPGAVEPPGPEAKDRDYPEMHPPDLGHRVLALARIWGTIHFFYPYLHLLDVSWDKVLRPAVSGFQDADSDERYARALFALANQITDAHTRLRGPAVEALVPRGWVPGGYVLLKEGLTVTATGPGSGGLRVGDVIRTVDGEDVTGRAERMSQLCTGSNASWKRYLSFVLAMRGAPGSTARLGVWDGKALRTVMADRVPFPEGTPRSSPAFRKLPDGTGYVDLTSLEVPDVPLMIEALGDTRAIVFDMRGYPRGTAWSIAPWLDRKRLQTAASFREPWVVGDADGRVTYQFDQPLPPSDRPRYQGKVAMLIDERAISQSEHTALFFERATDVLFVGSQTAGANGDVTTLALPGGLQLLFTGHDVRHADGRPLQRVGILPDVPVRPTAAGLRAGRDEVLERALRALETERGADTRPSRAKGAKGVPPAAGTSPRSG